MTGYELSRAWFNWAWENPDLVNPNHTALFMWIIEKKNRLGWPEKFGLPTGEAMSMLGIKSPKTYSKALSGLIEFGFIKMIQVSKNQNTANIIAIAKIALARASALDSALSQQMPEHMPQQVHYNKTNNHITNNHKPKSDSDLNEFEFPKENPARESVASAPEENAEAEELIRNASKAVAGFFNISEINHGSHFIKISNFVRFLHSQGKIGYFRKQLKGYMEIKKETPPRYRHKWYNYIGSPEKSYEDGAWNETDWWMEWKNTKKSEVEEAKENANQPPVYNVNLTQILAEQMEAIEADKAWYRKNRPEA